MSDGPEREVRSWDYDEYPKTLAPDDFWGQVRRTRYGKRISEGEVRVIVETIASGLDLQAEDILLDLACGNGALSSRLFESCRSFVGVDSSEYLIKVAKQNFERPPDYKFDVGDVVQFVSDVPGPPRFTKVLCYASLQYLPRSAAEEVLRGLNRRFEGVNRVFLGNVPDKERAFFFFGPETDYVDKLSEPASQIGVWWSEEELGELATAAGWNMELRRMPEHVFNANYRFDAVLTRS